MVSPDEREGKPASDVTLSRIFDTSIDDLWDAITNPDRLPHWFTNVTGDLQLNGRYHVQDNASGTITACEPQSHVALTWEFAGDTSWVELQFANEAPNQTRLTLSHTSILSDFWNTYGPGATGVGWEMAFLGLALHIAKPDDSKPDEMEFATSPEGIAFITGSSNAWAKADITAGTDPEKAQAAADQTTAFYTGQPVS
ncbi:MAG: SRPBCC family protein [Chloroflexi bacterium]|nr:SRPBCC family protein [Chloroflexota bacterium]MYK60644.1 SRPBCC family protein [Chloroflexota bacterium]